MKEIIEKQVLEWQQELIRQKEQKEKAEKLLAESNQNILVLTGGIQFGQAQLQKINSKNDEVLQIEGNKNEKK